MDFEALIKDAARLEGEGRYGEAVGRYDEALATRPDPVALLRKGMALAILKRYGEAIPCYDGALLLDPENHEALYSKSCSLLRLDRYADAARCCDEAIALDRGYARTYLCKAEAMIRLDRRDEAVKHHARALLMDPDAETCPQKDGMPAALNEVADESYKAALAACDERIRADPDCHRNFFTRAGILDRMGLHDRATKCYDWGMNLETQQPGFFCFTGHVNINMHRMGRYGIRSEYRGEPRLKYSTKDCLFPHGKNPDASEILALIDEPLIGNFYDLEQDAFEP